MINLEVNLGADLNVRAKAKFELLTEQLVKCGVDRNVDLDSLTDDEFGDFVEHTFKCRFHRKKLEAYEKEPEMLVREALSHRNNVMAEEAAPKIEAPKPVYHPPVAVINTDIARVVPPYFDIPHSEKRRSKGAWMGNAFLMNRLTGILYSGIFIGLILIVLFQRQAPLRADNSRPGGRQVEHISGNSRSVMVNVSLLPVDEISFAGGGAYTGMLNLIALLEDKEGLAEERKTLNGDVRGKNDLSKTKVIVDPFVIPSAKENERRRAVPAKRENEKQVRLMVKVPKVPRNDGGDKRLKFVLSIVDLEQPDCGVWEGEEKMCTFDFGNESPAKYEVQITAENFETETKTFKFVDLAQGESPKEVKIDIK